MNSEFRVSDQQKKDRNMEASNNTKSKARSTNDRRITKSIQRRFLWRSQKMSKAIISVGNKIFEVRGKV